MPTPARAERHRLVAGWHYFSPQTLPDANLHMSETRTAGRRRQTVSPSDFPWFGQRLLERRRALGLTQEDLASMAGVSRPTLMRWEMGRAPHTIPIGTLKRLEAALQVPADWLFSQEAAPPAHSGGSRDYGQLVGAARPVATSPGFNAIDIGSRAARFRAELGLRIPEVAHFCHQPSGVVREWEQGIFRMALTEPRLRLWERALRLAPGELVTPPASHPLVIDARWRVVVEADTVETAIHQVAECLAARGRNLLQPRHLLKDCVLRDAELFAQRYGIGSHRGQLIDVAMSHGIPLAYARQIVARMIVRAARFDFEIPVLAPFLMPGQDEIPPIIAVSDGCSRKHLGANLRFRDVVTFVSEILAARWNQRCSANDSD